MALITKSEILARLEGRGIAEEQIAADDIAVCELRYVRDVLGQDLYDAVVAGSGSDEDYEDFTDDYVKPVLAWGVFYHIFDRLQVEVSDRGVFQLQGDRAQIFDATNFKATLAENLNTFTDEMVRYVVAETEDENPLFYGLYTIDDTRQKVDNAVIYAGNTKRSNRIGE